MPLFRAEKDDFYAMVRQVALRSEDGFVILKRQVSTGWEKVRTFFADLAEKAAGT